MPSVKYLADATDAQDMHYHTLPEQERSLRLWNATHVDYPNDCCIHQLFEAQVLQAPNAVAVSFEDQFLTYQELNRRANQLAHHLQSLGVGPEVVVAICVERSLEMVVGLLGILKAGGAYVPLDPAYPRDRRAFMLQDSQAKVLLTTLELAAQFPEHTAQVLYLDADREAISSASAENPASTTIATSLAYIIYTSGSTGRPKGVMGLHHATLNRCHWMWQTYPFEAGEICCQKTALSFVDSIWEIFGPLLCGVQLKIIPGLVARDPESLVEALAAGGVTRIVLVPALLRAILDTSDDRASRLPRLKYWISSGETLPLELVRRFRTAMPGSVLLNLYGSSEVAADATWHEIRQDEMLASVPIGRPIANLQAYILDHSLRPVPVGATGQLYIGGAGLARGYYNQPDLTADRFIPDPFGLQLGGRLYRTGDLARYQADGTIEYLGRMDHQVKIRGHRIELGEIEVALQAHPSVREAIVVASDDPAGERCLVAYVTSGQTPAPLAHELRDFLKQKLPDHMLPSAFLHLDALPRTPNGKIDRLALPRLDVARVARERPHAEPRDSLELQLRTIWQQVLGIEAIGVNDDFFDLGGHSLLAVRLLTQIEQTFGKKLPLSTLVHAPTIELLAAQLRQHGCEATWSSLVPFRSSGTRNPFYCVHPDDGSALRFRQLAQYLGPDQPVYGLQAQGLDGEQAPHTRVEDMATHYVQEIRRLQPEGPYYLGGYCFGALVALEMAQQLQSQGQQVGMLAMFEPFSPYLMASTPRTTRFFYEAHLIQLRILANLRRLARITIKAQLSHIEHKARRLAQRLIRRVRQKITRTSPDLSQPLVDSLETVREACLIAEHAYAPRRFAGRFVLFVAHYPRIVRQATILRGWGSIATDGLEIHNLPGDHFAIFADPHVQILAKQLKGSLDRTQAQYIP